MKPQFSTAQKTQKTPENSCPLSRLILKDDLYEWAVVQLMALFGALGLHLQSGIF